MPKKRLLLIDGSSLLSVNFYGNLPTAYLRAKTEEEREKVLPQLLQTSTGRYTNGVLGMSRMILRLIEKQKPTHLAVAWDVTRNTFRRDLYNDYKATRSETKPELKEQFQTMQEVLQAMNIPDFRFKNYEADDIIGTLARRFEDEAEVFILTKDQDALQLVSEKTRLWLITDKCQQWYKELEAGTECIQCAPQGCFEFTPLLVKEIYDIYPQQVIDFKAIVGDKSDNIPGIKGVGEKTAIPLLQEFGSIEEIYERLEEVTPQQEKEFKAFLKELGIRKSPLKNFLAPGAKELGLLSKQLATIKTDIAELNTVQLKDLELCGDCLGTKRIFTELEFKSLLPRVEEVFPLAG